ncbi:hypothetical protein [Paenibacillus sp. FSL H8-0283]|uniref:hypothetical protein n=1 Tax=Paenibacillus sp. FSL H8-0283 TaxID=2921383 RepID=UPI0032502D02
MFGALKFDELSDFVSKLNEKENEYLKSGEELFNSQKSSFDFALDTFYISQNVIDGQKLMKKWFPDVNASVFLSHSHKDINEVYKFAGFLYDEFKIVSFIDAAVWGYADDLLKRVDNNECLDEKTGLYDYESRNITSSNIYLMLNNALYNMLDHVECVIFLSTPNSMEKISDEVEEKKTSSPWIFSELNMIQKIRREDPKRPDNIAKSIKHYALAESVKVIYDVKEQLSSLGELTIQDLEDMARNRPDDSSKSDYDKQCLDVLYKLKGWYK